MTGIRGGAWLLEDAAADTVCTPEAMTEEHRLIARAAADFMAKEIEPAIDRLERRDWVLARDLLLRCGALGLLGTDVPERYGGLDLDALSSFIVGEAVGRVVSFGTTFGAQVGLSILPLLCFGSDTQKALYLPRLVTGELVGAYALSEAGSGSDALAARTRATRLPDGSFRLNGEKLWITNGGFADLFIVFAKVDGEQFTAFLVERAFPGVSNGAEEHKMGLHGSSTTPLLLQDAGVPAGNVLGTIGQGHKVAFNALNYGRFKLAAMCSGGARTAIAEAARYAAGRKQFGRAIGSFGAIRHKLAEMAIREFAVESMLYRAAGLLDCAAKDDPERGRTVAALEELAIEASILKVAASEMLDYVVDENVQVHGGNGFVHDSPPERRYRDARVNRIFEGTNEINRQLIAGMLLRRATNGRWPALAATLEHDDPLAGSTGARAPARGPLGAKSRTVSGMKQVALLVMRAAVHRFGPELTEQQEILSSTADILIDVFGAESCVLRAVAAPPIGFLQLTAARVFVNDAAARVECAARTALCAITPGAELNASLTAMPRLLQREPVDTVFCRRQIADAILDRAGYPF